ncbi:MAG TPA: hypothetical protein VNS49_06595 [Streptomyces sp.]|nr:hypothetical protein [Streptomyces sp.]
MQGLLRIGIFHATDYMFATGDRVGAQAKRGHDCRRIEPWETGTPQLP